MEREEGHIEVPGGRVWWARLGGGTAEPLLMLHGGPGAAHDYIAPVAEGLAADRPVIVFDQLGCGRSDQPDDPTLWTLDRAVAEVDAVRDALGLDRCHLLGHSWGGWLTIEYMARGATGLSSLVLASTSASMREFLRETDRLIAAMPDPHRTALVELGAQERFDDPDYHAALDVFYHRHLCRLDPWPQVLVDSLEGEGENQAYRVMAGPNDIVVDGPLLAWDRSDAIASFDLPVLVTVGRYDEITPACSETLVAGLPHARLAVFEQSGHLAHLEELDAYVAAVRAFLAEVDRGLTTT